MLRSELEGITGISPLAGGRDRLGENTGLRDLASSGYGWLAAKKKRDSVPVMQPNRPLRDYSIDGPESMSDTIAPIRSQPHSPSPDSTPRHDQTPGRARHNLARHSHASRDLAKLALILRIASKRRNRSHELAAMARSRTTFSVRGRNRMSATTAAKTGSSRVPHVMVRSSRPSSRGAHAK